MDRAALVPVVAGSVVVVVVATLVSGTLEHGLELPVVYADAVENGGIALVFVGIMLLSEALSYENYRTKGLVRVGTDGAAVFAVAAVVTLTLRSAFDLAGLGDLGGEAAGVVFDIGSVLAAVAAFAAAAVLFIRGAGAIPRPSGRGYAPSLHATIHRLYHCWISHNI